MEKIIVATDFSASSIHALEYAIMVANRAKASIILVWVNNLSSREGLIGISSEMIETEAAQRLSGLIEKYKPKLEAGSMTYKIRNGRIYKEVANQAKYDDADLIICGAHGASGFENNWAGSNAFRILSYAQCPVITVRHSYSWTIDKSGNIILPIDSTENTRQKVDFTCELAKILDCTIHVLGLYTTSLSSIRRKVDSYVNQVEKYIREEGIPVWVEKLHADNVTKTTLTYAESVKADLISIMTEQEKSAYNLILGPYAQQMVNTSIIPVLGMTPKEINPVSE